LFYALLSNAQIRSMDPPALEQSGMPFLAQSSSGQIYLSWIDPLPNGEHALRFSQWSGTAWSKPETVANGRNWFVNWADFPSIAIHPDGTLFAHWLARPAAGGKWGYGIHIAQRDPKTGVWRESAGLSTDNKEDYAGFLSFVSQKSISGAVYLSPPEQTKAAVHDHQNHSGEEHRKTLRFVVLGPDGSVLNDRELDADACSCCQTAIAATSSALLAAYRDHLPGEIRDISIVRFVDGAWTPPRTLHEDGWKINGCPTDGPTIATVRDHAAIAWLTRAGGVAKVQLAVSADAGASFSKPVRVDDGNPLGRPVLTPLDERSYLIAWLEKTDGAKAEVRLRRVTLNGQQGSPITAATVPSGRAVGLPKIAVSGNQIMVAWRDERVRVALLPKQQFTKESK